MHRIDEFTKTQSTGGKGMGRWRRGKRTKSTHLFLQLLPDSGQAVREQRLDEVSECLLSHLSHFQLFWVTAVEGDGQEEPES